MIKEELRRAMREQRRALTADNVKELSASIKENLFSLGCVKNADIVCVFLSAFKEPDTYSVIRELIEEGKKIVVPVTDMENVTLSLSYINGTNDLKKGAYGISEPSVIQPAAIEDTDVILVPGLAFDRSGGRMGFGKGYYDRLLDNTRCIKIGLCYDFQLHNTIPTQSHDVMMDFVVTEKEIVKIK